MGFTTFFLVVVVACYSIYLGVTSSAVKDKVEEVKNQIPSIPKTKVGELYHQTAAKVDGLMGDRVNQLKHEAVVAAKQTQDALEGDSGVVGKLKSWTGFGTSATEEAKEKLKQRAADFIEQAQENYIPTKEQVKDAAVKASVEGVNKAQEAYESGKEFYNQIPNSKTGEMYHKAAAKVNEMMGDDTGKYRHEALLGAKGVKDTVTDAVEGAKEKLQEWTGMASDKAQEAKDNLRQQASDVQDRFENAKESMKESARDAPMKAASKAYEGAQAVKEFQADIPTTKVGELYHKAAAKVDGVLGARESQLRHEALVQAKEVKDNVNDVKEAAQEKAKGAVEKVKEWTGMA